MNKRQKGYAGERVVVDYYINRGYQHIVNNFTIRGGEIDCVMEGEKVTVFIEVKVIDTIEDIFDYVTEKKLYFLHKCIAQYCQEHAVKEDVRLDVVFVRDGKVSEVYENVGG